MAQNTTPSFSHVQESLGMRLHSNRILHGPAGRESLYMHGCIWYMSPKFFLLSFSACVLSHRKSSDKWEELSHNYVLRTVYQGGFPSLELVEALHSSLNLQ